MSWPEPLRPQGHPFYERLQEILRGAGFDRHVETLCQPHYSSVVRGRKVAAARAVLERPVASIRRVLGEGGFPSQAQRCAF